MEADHDGDGKLSFEEFTNVVAKTVRISSTLTHLSPLRLMCGYFYPAGYCQANDVGTPILIILTRPPLFRHTPHFFYHSCIHRDLASFVLTAHTLSFSSWTVYSPLRHCIPFTWSLGTLLP